MNLSQTLNELGSYAHRIYETASQGFVPRPVTRKAFGHVETNVDLLSVYFGSRNDIQSIKQKGALRLVDMVEGLVQQTPSLRTIYVRAPEFSADYHFGARQIMESMAYAVEQIVAPNSDLPPDIPYLLGSILLENHTGIADVSTLIAALDASLMFLHPGEAFFELLNAGAQDLASPTAIFEWWRNIENLTPPQPSNVPATYDQMVDHTIGVIRNSIRGAALQPMVNWLCETIESVKNLRLGSPTFLTDALSASDPKSAILALMARTGLPALSNDLQDIFVAELPVNTIEPDKILYWYALSEVFAVLTEPKNHCGLLKYCEIHSEQLHPDTHCTAAPWERGTDQYKYLCYFGALWKTLGFARYRYQ